MEVKCDVKNFRFSAHSKREELLSLVGSLQPKNVILVHGETTSIDWVGAAILKNYPGEKVFAASTGKGIMFD
ncbi:MAG: MBL fold metallo-hydrolase RNA specificity domain-containing protein [Ignavibacteriaceae bacterium]